MSSVWRYLVNMITDSGTALCWRTYCVRWDSLFGLYVRCLCRLEILTIISCRRSHRLNWKLSLFLIRTSKTQQSLGSRISRVVNCQGLLWYARQTQRSQKTTLRHLLRKMSLLIRNYEVVSSLSTKFPSPWVAKYYGENWGTKWRNWLKWKNPWIQIGASEEEVKSNKELRMQTERRCLGM